MARTGLETPLVGRSPELAALTAALDRAAAGRPSAVLLAGDAGVGKTRLLSELVGAARAAGATVLVGHCLDIGGVGLPYLPFTEALRPLMVAGEGDPGGVPRLGYTPAGEVGQLQLFDAVVGLLGRAAPPDKGPLLLVLEDLHWADQSTRDLLAFLVGRLRDERLLLVGSYRSDDLHRRHPMRQLLAQLARLPLVERIDLAPFDLDEMTRYLAVLRGAPVDDETVQRILDRSEGNAYYAQELLLSLRSGDAAASQLGPLPTPLAEVLLTRVEQLSGPAQQVVRVASAAGRQVGHELLAQASGLDSDALDAAQREAAAHQVLEPADRDSYAFRHALLAEAVYGDLLPGERARLHSTYARLIRETLDGPAPLGSAAELAHHYLEAHDLPGALQASLRAAEEAERLHAPAEAWQQLEQALRLWESVPDAKALTGTDVVSVGLAAAAAASRAGQNSRAVALSEAAAAQLDVDADPLHASAVHHKRALHLLGNNEIDAGLAAAQESRRLAELATKEPTPQSAWAAATTARALLNLDRYAEAQRHGELARGEAEAVGSAGAQADVLVTLAGLDDHSGRAGGRPSLLERARDLAQDSGDLPTELRVSFNLAVDAYDAGDVVDALRIADAAVDRSIATGLAWSPYGLELRSLQVTARYVTGDWDGSEAAGHFAGPLPSDMAMARLAGVTLYAKVGRGDPGAAAMVSRLESAWSYDPMISMTTGGSWSELLRWQGDPEAALAAAEKTLEFVEKQWPGFLGAIWLGAVGMAAAGDLAEHARLVHDAAALATATEGAARLADHAQRNALAGRPRRGVMGPEGSAWLLRLEAERSRVDGRSDVEQWRKCVDAFDYGHVYEVARCRWRLAEAMLGAGDRAAAAVEARAAHDVAVALGAQPLRDAVESLVRRGRLDVGLSAAAAPSDDSGLTSRELEVLRLLAEGLSNRQIGERLFISQKTASVHVSNILAKLGVSGRTEAVVVAHRRGLVGGG